MKTKKSQLKRLLAIYTVFLLLLLAGALHGSSDFIRGFSDGQEMADRFDKDMGNSYEYFVTDIPVYTEFGSLAVAQPADSVYRLNSRVDHISILVKKKSHDPAPQVIFRMFADNGYLYIAVMLILFSKLGILILMGMIINSLRKSIRDELPLNRRNILYTRLIGIILICAELLNGVVEWCQRTEAARLLEGSVWTVDTSFPLSYWDLVMGVLVVFMAEVFAIGTRLSEEQKFTI